MEKEKYNIEINKLQIELNETKEGKNLIIKEKEELDNEIKKMNLINNKQAKEIGNQNGIIKQLNQKILNLSSTLKLKENEIQIEKNTVKIEKGGKKQDKKEKKKGGFC